MRGRPTVEKPAHTSAFAETHLRYPLLTRRLCALFLQTMFMQEGPHINPSSHRGGPRRLHARRHDIDRHWAATRIYINYQRSAHKLN